MLRLTSSQLQQSHFSYPNTAYDAANRTPTSNYSGFPPLSIPSSHYNLPPSTSASSSSSQYPLLGNNYRRPSYDQSLGAAGGGGGGAGNGQGGYGERPYSFDRERGDLDRIGGIKRERDDSPSSSSNPNQTNPHQNQNPTNSSNTTPNSRASLPTYSAQQPPYLYPFPQQMPLTNPYLVNPQNIINTTGIAGGSTSGNVAPLSEESHSGREDENAIEVTKKPAKRARGGENGAEGEEGGGKRDPLKRYVSWVLIVIGEDPEADLDCFRFW